MATTMKEIIDAAKAYSTFSDGERTVTVYELVGVISRYMKHLYSLAARRNRYYFAARETVAYVAASTLGWPRPADAEMVIRIEKANGDRVTIMPLEDAKGELPPVVYEEGQVYKTAGRTGDPLTTDSLIFVYSRSHPLLNTTGLTVQAAEALTLHPTWPEEFNELPILQVAKYMARKDGRHDDVSAFDAEQQVVLQSFIMHLGHENAGMSSRFAHDRLVGLNVQGKKGE